MPLISILYVGKIFREYKKIFKLGKINAASDFWFTTSAKYLSGCMLAAIDTNYEVHCEVSEHFKPSAHIFCAFQPINLHIGNV